MPAFNVTALVPSLQKESIFFSHFSIKPNMAYTQKNGRNAVHKEEWEKCYNLIFMYAIQIKCLWPSTFFKVQSYSEVPQSLARYPFIFLKLAGEKTLHRLTDLWSE